MAKSRVRRLQEALERGDVDGAKKLAAEIEEATKKKAPRKPAKGPSKRAASRARRPPADAPGEPPGPSPIIVPGVCDRQPPTAGQSGENRGDGVWIAPPRGLARPGPGGGEKVRARHESMQGHRHVNQFEQWAGSQERGFDGMDARMKKSDRKLAHSPCTPRPGMPGAARPPAARVHVYCDGCGRPFDVYPSELTVLDSESVYKCDRCILRGR